MKTDRISNSELRKILTERYGPEIAAGMNLAEVRRAFANTPPEGEHLRLHTAGHTRQHPRWDNG